MTYSEVLSTIRQTIKEVDDDSKYTDSYLYSLWKMGRAKFLSQRLKSKNYVDRQNWITVCLELELAKSHDCSCILVGCDVLKTKHPIATSMTGRVTSNIEVLTLDGTLIPHRHAYEIKTDMYDPIKSDKLGYTIVNNKIVIWNTLELKAIQIRQLSNDPLYYQDIQYCSSSTDTPDCVDIYSLETGLPEELEELTLRNTLELLNIPLTRPDDTSSDANPENR